MASSILRPGDVLGGYRVDEVIGLGGTAIVYRAEQISLGRPVALKVLSDHLARDDAFRERFRREGKHLAAFEHPNIVPVHDSGERDGLLYLAMRFVEGTNLAQLIRDKSLDAQRTVNILIPIANALDAAHADGLIHRDIKPQNILITERGHPYLADFGVAKGSNTYGLTATGGFVGTVNYASPEQIEGSMLTNASDIYALTAVLYHCLTGEVPYLRETDPAIMHAHLHEPPPTLPGSGDEERELRDAIVRGMAKEPSSRYPYARDLIGAASHAVNRMPQTRRHLIPAFKQTVDSGVYRAPQRKVHSGLAAPTAADQRRKAPDATPSPSVVSSSRWRLWAVAGGLLAVTLAVCFLLLDRREPSAKAVHRAVPDLVESLRPTTLARARLGKGHSHDARSLSAVESLLAAGDDSAVARLLRVSGVSRAQRTGVTTLADSLSNEADVMRSLSEAARRDDRARYASSAASIPAIQTSLARAIREIRAAGFTAPTLSAVTAKALKLPTRPRRKTHHRPEAVVHQAGGSVVKSAPSVVSTTPEYVPPPVVSHSAPVHKGSSGAYAPTVVAPPVG